MRKTISFIAIGQAGGNIGQLLEQRGFEVLYLNTSKEDLDTIKGKYKYHIKEREGANKDREKAKKIIIEDFDNVSKEIEDKITNNIVFLLFAAGGGTGSGIAPALMKMLIHQEKKVGAITILPDKSESVKAHINTYECFTELIKIKESAAVFVLDNEKGEKLSLNRNFVSDFCKFIEIPNKFKSKKGNIDVAEVKEVLLTHGMSIVTSASDNTADVINKIKNNIYSDMEQDKVLKYIGVALTENIDIYALEKEIGIPLDRFIAYTEREIIFGISGLSYPETRLNQIKEIIETNKEKIVKNLKAVKETGLSENINFLNEIEAEEIKQEEKNKKPDKNKTSRELLEEFFKF